MAKVAYLNPSSDGFEAVKTEMIGRWVDFYTSRYPEVSKALQTPLGKHRCTDPVNGTNQSSGMGDGFRFYEDVNEKGGGHSNMDGPLASGVDFICWIERSSPYEAICILESYLGWRQDGKLKRKPLPEPKQGRVVKQQEPTPAEIEDRNRVLETIWNDAVPFSELSDDHQVMRYLTETRGLGSRKLVCLQKFMRFHPGLIYFEDEGNGSSPTRVKLPGIVSLFHNKDRNLTGLHRTFLHPTEPRKADVKRKTKALRRLSAQLHGAVTIGGLSSKTSHINICEGIETGLSIVAATGKPVEACTTTSLLGNWEPYDGVRYASIWIDRDLPSPKTGEQAGLRWGKTLQARLADKGIVSRLIIPPKVPGQGEKSDWNDVLKAFGRRQIIEAYQGNANADWYQ